MATLGRSKPSPAPQVKRLMRSAVVGGFAAVVASEVRGVEEPLLWGAVIGVTHYFFDQFLAWLFHPEP
jgi:hypothetical protein